MLLVINSCVFLIEHKKCFLSKIYPIFAWINHLFEQEWIYNLDLKIAIVYT